MDKKLRILRVANVPNNRIGGMSRFMYLTGDELKNNGHEIDYIFSEDLIKFFGKKSRHVVGFQIFKLICDRIKNGKRYDLVEIHEPIAAVYAIRRKLKGGLPPLVVMSHGIERRAQLEENKYYKMKKLKRSLSMRTLRLAVLQSEIAIRLADHVICLNREDRNYLSVRLPQNKVTQIHNGVSDFFLEMGEKNNARCLNLKNILFVGTWIIRKGILDLVSAMTELFANPSLGNLQLTIAGAGKERHEIVGLFPEIYHNRIHVISKIHNEMDLISVYLKNDILVLPSFFEGQPLVMLEAAALGQPTVTTNICGMADFIEDRKNGCFFPVGDAIALRECIEWLLKSPQTITTLGNAARLKAKDYTWRSSALMIEQAYYKAINQWK